MRTLSAQLFSSSLNCVNISKILCNNKWIFISTPVIDATFFRKVRPIYIELKHAGCSLFDNCTVAVYIRIHIDYVTTPISLSHAVVFKVYCFVYIIFHTYTVYNFRHDNQDSGLVCHRYRLAFYASLIHGH